MNTRQYTSIVQCGRLITGKEIRDIAEIVCLFPRLSRMELVRTICENLEWFTASGSGKVEACFRLLEKLESQGIIRLPEKQIQMARTSSRNGLSISRRTEPGEKITGTLKALGTVWLDIAKAKEEADLFNEYIYRYHYLKYKRPFGYRLRYFVRCEQGLLGCVLFSGAAKALRARDRWIGWADEQRLNNLAWLIGNSRFLIFPWVKVKNLCSHMLARITGRIGDDWYNRWGYSPVLMEAFVDPKYFKGICYQAAGWEYLGMTTGEGLVRKGKSYKTTPKKIFVKPLVGNFRELLCSNVLVGRREI